MVTTLKIHACTLAYEYFIGFYSNADDDSNLYDNNRPIWTYIISYYIVLMPCVALLTANPLNCITLSNMIEQAFLNDEQLNDIKFLVVVRVGIVTLATLLGLVVWEFTYIIIFVGICGVFSTFVCIPYAEYVSQNIFNTCNMQ